jgi:hypothetical protein
MGYLQALNLLVRAYKAARGVMPKGLDLLKIKMKARRKAIDSQKVVEFPKDRITDPFKPRNQIAGSKREKGLEIAKDRMKRLKETEAETIARMNRQNKEAAQRIRDKKKPKEDKAEGGITGAIKKIKRRFGKKSITTGDKIKRPGNRQLFDDFKKRNKFNVGGMANLSQTYDNNPTLQAQFPNKQDYLDLFSSTTTTTPQTQTYAQMTQQQPAAGIPAVKPIVPIIPPQGDGGDGGGGITRTGYGYRGPSMTIDDIEEGTITPEEERFATGQSLRSLAEKTLLGNLFFKTKDAASDKAREIADKVRAEEIAKAEALRSLQEAIARNQARASQQDWSGASSDYTGGFDPSTGNYDDPYSPGDTE